jgi:hypothetical protein
LHFYIPISLHLLVFAGDWDEDDTLDDLSSPFTTPTAKQRENIRDEEEKGREMKRSYSNSRIKPTPSPSQGFCLSFL